MKILFYLGAYKSLAKELVERGGFREGKYSVNKFQNGELQVILKSVVSGADCVLLGSITGSTENMFLLMLLANTLKTQGARRVYGLLPYLGYGRQDKFEKSKSLAISWLGAALKVSGFHKLVTLDLHSKEASGLLGLRVLSLNPTRLFVKKMGLMVENTRDWCVIAPDFGAVARAVALSKALGIENVGRFKKLRERGVKMFGFSGEVSKNAIIVDGMLDTGSTLLAAASKLLEMGVLNIYICATHGIFSGRKWRELFRLKVRRIYVTDSLPHVAIDSRVRVLKSASILAATFR